MPRTFGLVLILSLVCGCSGGATLAPSPVLLLDASNLHVLVGETLEVRASISTGGVLAPLGGPLTLSVADTTIVRAISGTELVGVRVGSTRVIARAVHNGADLSTTAVVSVRELLNARIRVGH
jgi:hypothetical protein